MVDLWRLSGLELRKMIAAKEVKPSEIMAAVLARIEKLNPKLNAFCTITRDLAMAEARQADKKMTRRRTKGHSSAFPCPLRIWFSRRVSAQPLVPKCTKILYRIRMRSSWRGSRQPELLSLAKRIRVNTVIRL